MTIQELSQSISHNPTPVYLYFALIPAIAFGMGLIDKDNRPASPWRYIYSVLIYLSCIPGILGLMLTISSFLFRGGGQAHIETHYLPLISMIITLVVISKEVDLRYIPGFDKLSALMLIIGITFIILYILNRMHFMVFFTGSVQGLMISFAVMFGILYFAWNRLISGGKPDYDEPRPF